MNSFELWFPVKPYHLNQSFGENKSCVDNATSQTVITCDGLNPPAGFRSTYSMMKGHNGLDLRATSGQPVYCAHEGTVEEIETEELRGLGISVVSNQPYDLGTLGTHLVKTRYWHLKGFAVSLGQQVKAGTLLGFADNTGFSSGDHLHFELKPVDKIDLILYNTYQDNGFFGAVDPSKYWNKFYSQDEAIVTSLLTRLVELLGKLLVETLKAKANKLIKYVN